MLKRGVLLAAILSLLSASWAAASQVEPALQLGFNDMYNLSFAQAHQCFRDWEKTHADDPRGPVFDAAAYLFSEFDRLRILQSQFFVDDRNFSGRAPPPADMNTKRSFMQALDRGRQLADVRLRKSPRDEIALFAMVVSFGLEADYDALIDKHNLRALNATKQGRLIATRLLEVNPHCYDAYIAEGVENYLLSQKAAPVRWLLHATGSRTDKETGIARLRLTAEKGEYLRPYAQLLLAVAALRDQRKDEARQLLASLAERFPGNRLYREELAKLQQ
jgi:hypothetical protein